MTMTPLGPSTRPRVALLLVAAGVGLLSTSADVVAQVSSDERVVLFPVAASPSPGGGWTVPVHGWIFEPEEDDLLRGLIVEKVRKDLGLDPSAAEADVFRSRVGYLLRDNERGKRVPVELGGRVESLGPSGDDGHFTGEVRLSEAEAKRRVLNGALTLRVKAPPAGGDELEGRVHLVGPEGISVVSDIDDTIKDTGVTEPVRLARSTFLEDFRPVPGMAGRYSAWEKQGTAFHYVSSCPWQLYEPLSEFMAREGFPKGALHLKRFRLKDESVVALFQSPMKTKPPVIESIMRGWPRRTFVLVGDSGEKDPEVYGEIARRLGDHVAAIYIRDVTREPATAERYAVAFEGVPRQKWRLFREAAELPLSLNP